MRCNECESYLNAMADGELSPLMRWRVWRHLRGCPACFRVLADIIRIDTMADAFRKATATVALPDSLKTNVLQDTHLTDELQVDRPTVPALQKEKPIMIRLVPVFAAASLLAMIGTITVVPNMRPHVKTRMSGIAFAAVEDAVDKVKTAHIRFQEQPDTVSNPGVSILTYDAWLQADPPLFSLTMPNTRMIGDHTGMTMYVDGVKPIRVTDTPLTRAIIQKEMLFPKLGIQRGDPNTPVPNWGSSTPAHDDVTGLQLQRFTVTENGVRRTLWVDPGTRLPIRIEVEIQTNPAPDTAKVTTRYQVEFFYNETPPTGAFQPPVAKE